jgi:uncharacterized protein YkwD
VVFTSYKKSFTPVLTYCLILLTASLFVSLGFSTETHAIGFNNSDLYSLTNEHRQSNNLNDLTPNPRLEAAAAAKAEDMLSNQYWSHYAPNGIGPWEFIKESGYDYTNAGENLAVGYPTSISAFEGWLASASHRANIEGEYTEIGVAIIKGDLLDRDDTYLVVVMYATPTTLSAGLVSVLEPNTLKKPISTQLSAVELTFFSKLYKLQFNLNYLQLVAGGLFIKD